MLPLEPDTLPSGVDVPIGIGLRTALRMARVWVTDLKRSTN